MKLSNSKFNEMNFDEMQEVDGGLILDFLLPTVVAALPVVSSVGVTYHATKGVFNMFKAAYDVGYYEGKNG